MKWGQVYPNRSVLFLYTVMLVFIWNEFTLSESIEKEPVAIDWFVFYLLILTPNVESFKI